MPKDRPRKYIKAVRGATRMQPSWPPSAHRELGDVGVFRNGQFERKGTMESLFGVEAIPRDVPGNSTSYHCDSDGNVRIHSHGTAGVAAGPVAADASLRLHFGKADAVLFHATGCWSEEIKNIESVEARMRKLSEEKKWPRGYVVVTEVTHAARTTVLMCRNSKEHVELRASADPGVSGLDLLTASGGLTWAGGSVASLQLLSEGELTPLYRVRGMVRHWFRDDEPGYLDEGTTEDEQGEGEWYVDEVSSETFDVGDAEPN
ncbi:hypothetical protein ACIOKD_02180 [Streptomyces sp. NPDC087844]|uniref:hypothetical protein n=1 Tax=Streptomyces sp. NPDC087844 TaxID=3365805 RepID=UPI00381E3F0C